MFHCHSLDKQVIPILSYLSFLRLWNIKVNVCFLPQISEDKFVIGCVAHEIPRGVRIHCNIEKSQYKNAMMHSLI